MATGSSKAKIHDQFHNRLVALEAWAAAMSDRPSWCLADADANPLDPATMTGDAFDRSAINENYQACMADASTPGTHGDVASLKRQIDYLAAEERAYRLRHASQLRCAAMSRARLNGHGRGTMFRRVEQVCADLFSAGGAYT